MSATMTIQQASIPIKVSSPTDERLPVKKHWSKKTMVPYLVLAFLQFTSAGYQILTRVALVHGIDPLLFTSCRNLIAGIFLAPGAYFIER